MGTGSQEVEFRDPILLLYTPICHIIRERAPLHSKIETILLCRVKMIHVKLLIAKGKQVNQLGPCRSSHV